MSTAGKRDTYKAINTRNLLQVNILLFAVPFVLSKPRALFASVSTRHDAICLATHDLGGDDDSRLLLP